MLKRRKRSHDYDDGEKKSKGVKMYEYYESKRTKSKKPNHRDMTTTVYTNTKTIIGKDKEPKHRERLTIYRKPQPQPHEYDASEADDLANDQYFYDQLEKNKPTTESGADVEHVHGKRPNPNPNRDVVFFHGGNGNKRGKHRLKNANIQISTHTDGTQDEDIFGDYGEMIMPDRDVEMHDTYEKNTKEFHVHRPAQYAYDEKLRPKKIRRPPTCITQNPIIQSPRHTDVINSHGLPHNHQPLSNQENLKHHKTVIVHQPVRKRKFERIMVTKKLSSPDELHAEIDKIFQTKNKHYDQRGHEKSHWELRIVPQRYDDDHEEQKTN